MTAAGSNGLPPGTTTDTLEIVSPHGYTGSEPRLDIMKDSRDELRDLDERVQKLQNKAQGATVEEKNHVATALTGWTSKREAAERDIEALKSVAAANLNRAKETVKKELSSLDKTLDKAESAL